MSRRRHHRVRPDQYLLLNCEPGERWRQHAETREDVTTAVAGELEAAMSRVQVLSAEAESILDGHFLGPRREATLAHLGELGETITRLYRRAWVRHTHLRDVLKPTSPPTVKQLWQISWIHVATCRILVDQVEEMIHEEKGFDPIVGILDNKASAYRYVDDMGSTRCQLSLSDVPLREYSPQLLFTAARVLCEALDAYGWTRSAGEYLYALYLRYAMILADPATFARSEAAKDLGRWGALLAPGEPPPPPNEEDEDDDDAGMQIDGVNDDPRRTEREPLLDPAPLRAAFLDVGERLFFTHLWRDHILRTLPGHSVAGAAANAEEEEEEERVARVMRAKKALAKWRLETGLPALRALVEGWLSGAGHRDDLINDVQNLYPERLLWPAEPDQFRFEYKNEADGGEAHAVLFRLRFAAYKRMTETLNVDQPLAYVDAYIVRETAIARTILDTPDTVMIEDDDYVAYVPPGSGPIREQDVERVLLLLLERIVDRSVEAGTHGDHTGPFAKTTYVDDRSLEGERGRPPFDAETWHELCRVGTWPRFMAVWLNYTVSPPGPMDTATRTQHTLRSRHLIDAFAAWLALAMRAPGCRHILEEAGFCSLGSAARHLALPTSLYPLPATWPMT
jgi:hypothetical protein